MNTQIFIVSYSKDIPWLEYCLRSISKFCQGFGGTRLLVPQQEQHLFTTLAAKHGVILLTYDRNTPPIKWHIHHQLEKCRADQWCPDADFILHTDSDCVFRETVTPGDYFHDRKPILLMEPYTAIDHPHRGGWKATTERAVGFPVEYEFMCRHPAVHYQALYGDIRRTVEQVHGTSFEDYVLSVKPDYPWGISEHNVMGAIAHTAKWHDLYHWIDVSKEARPHDKLLQFWSHGDMAKEQEIWTEGKKLPVVPRTFFDQLP